MSEAKNRPGRPRTGRKGGKVLVYMSPEDKAKAEAIGDGNVSKGIRVALAACKR